MHNIIRPNGFPRSWKTDGIRGIHILKQNLPFILINAHYSSTCYILARFSSCFVTHKCLVLDLVSLCEVYSLHFWKICLCIPAKFEVHQARADDPECLLDGVKENVRSWKNKGEYYNDCRDTQRWLTAPRRSCSQCTELVSKLCACADK